MNKLESLNSPKYSLTPEKMGELVGGAVTTTCTDNGNGYSLGRHRGNQISADYTIRYTGKDVQNGIIEENYVYTGSNDVAIRNAEFNKCNCR